MIGWEYPVNLWRFRCRNVKAWFNGWRGVQLVTCALEDQVTFVTIEISQEVSWRRHTDLIWILETKVILVAELQLFRQL